MKVLKAIANFWGEWLQPPTSGELHQSFLVEIDDNSHLKGKYRMCLQKTLLLKLGHLDRLVLECSKCSAPGAAAQPAEGAAQRAPVTPHERNDLQALHSVLAAAKGKEINIYDTFQQFCDELHGGTEADAAKDRARLLQTRFNQALSSFAMMGLVQPSRRMDHVEKLFF
mmetsp:Transcript_44328/g.111678  ORF Transcript_44328/g.111678 Transcript_44328/m.111678 type:complete len:169 (+) Transcript_44328:175-681(+)